MSRKTRWADAGPSRPWVDSGWWSRGHRVLLLLTPSPQGFNSGHHPPAPWDHEFASSESRDDACQMRRQTTTTADYAAEREGQETCPCWEGQAPWPLREDARVESPGKGRWDQDPPRATSPPSSWVPVRPFFLKGALRFPDVPRSLEKGTFPGEESLRWGFLIESAQPFSDDSENSNITVAECEDEASVSRLDVSFDKRLQTWTYLCLSSVETPR